MNSNEKEIRILIYLSKEPSPEGKKEFDNWLKEDPEAQLIFKKSIKTYHQVRWSQKWDSIDVEVAREKLMSRIHRKKKITYLRYAASLALLLLPSLFYFWNYDKQTSQDSGTVSQIVSIRNNTPVLKLSNGQKISVSKQSKEIIQSINQVSIRMTDSCHLEYIPQTDTSSHHAEYNTLIVPRGCEFQLTLADGSQIWLNAESSLTYPERFSSEKREVFLTGEAYFKVQANIESPFIVNAGKMRLRVLGTSFNIKAYEDEENITTTLISGKIEQFYPEIKQRIYLTPSDQSKYNRNSGELKTQSVDVSEVLAWREGIIIANDERLEDIFKQLARWYDFNVIYTSPELKEIRFHFQSKRYAEIQTILEHIQTTKSIRFSCIGKTIYISK